MKKILAICLTLCMALSLFAGCSSTASSSTASSGTASSSTASTDSAAPAASASSDTIRVGVFECLTGADAAGGEYELRGVQLANALYPEVLGKKVELVIVDNKSDVVEAATAASRLVDEEKVDVVLGSWGSSYCMAAGATFAAAKTPAIGISCTSANVTIGNDYYFRVCFLEKFKAYASAEYLIAEGYTKAAIMKDIASDASVGMVTNFTTRFTELGGTIVSEVAYSKGDQEFSSQLLTIDGAGAECVYIAGDYVEAALMVKQCKQLGLSQVFNGGDGLDVPELNEIGGKDIDGTTFVTFFDQDSGLTAETDTFVNAYKAKYPGEDASALSALGYDAYLAAIKAIEAAGTTDGPALRDAIAALSVEGCTGVISFDENGDAIKNAGVIKIVKDGLSVFYKNVTVDMG